MMTEITLVVVLFGALGGTFTWALTVKWQKNLENEMEIKCLELRDAGTFIPVICIRPVAENESQRYLLRRDGYRADHSEHCIIMIDAQCRGCSYDPYNWIGSRTKGQAHSYIEEHWHELSDGDVIDVQFILGETRDRKRSEREGASP
jgi:hypothetical protein